MEGLKISEMDAAASLDGAEVFPVLDGAANKSATVEQVKDYILSGDLIPGADNTNYIGKNDDDTPAAYKGIVLKDQTDGKYYRVELNNGAVSVVDLTD